MQTLEGHLLQHAGVRSKRIQPGIVNLGTQQARPVPTASRDATTKRKSRAPDEATRDTRTRTYSTAFTISSITFFASPNTIIVLSM
ncbi:hypothetical protein LMG27177_01562 [Paraburkholderia fynbosensis]|uniref:Uncharacterized protein n=1 Tax=Paraburkholderia fynbosensis TaxID=1200993 RepID=A0A6J5FRA4_9BURK|nr:hypothetical protein LMG27177_01562 [Paraburkholderia fynbosensis]